MAIYSIYKFTNRINNKTYVGYTNNINTRLFDHQYNSQDTENKNKFYEAVREYGWDSFDFEVIYQSKDGKYCEYIMEPHFIREFNSFREGYNSNNGKCKRAIEYYQKLYGMN